MPNETDRCWKCGYDLTKAAGEYVRCPECGMVTNRLTAQRDLEWWRVRRWTRWMVGCTAGVCAAVVGVGAAVALVGIVPSDAKVWWVLWGAWSLVVGGIIWVVVWAMTPGERRPGKLAVVIVTSILLGGGVTLAIVQTSWIALIWVLRRHFTT